MGSGSGSGGNLKSDQGGNWRRKDGPDMLTGRIKNSEREREKEGRVVVEEEDNEESAR